MNKTKVVVKVILVGIVFTKLYATYLDLGNKPIALGSAYTAVSGDVYSLYVNPAGLYGGRSFDLKFDLLAGANLTGDILYNLNQIADSAAKYEKIQKAQKEGGNIDVVQVAALFNAIKNLVDINQPGKGVLVGVSGGIGVKIKNFAFSVRNVTNVGLKPVVDDNFFLGSVSTSTTPAPYILKSLYFSNGTGDGGVVITTDTLKNTNLTEARNKLRDEVIQWLVNELKDLGVKVPPEIEGNYEGIANALINLAEQQGASTQEITDAVNLLADKNFQNFISNYIDTLQGKQVQSFTENNSGLIFKGINYTEVAIGYSHKFFHKLLVGASLKYLIARTLYYRFKVFQEGEEIDPDYISKTISERLEKTYTGIGLDVGTIYELPIPVVKTTAGLVIKNLIEPKFDIEGTNESIKLPRQAKLGISGTLWKRITLSIDYDLNEVETLVPGYKIQNFGLGLQLDPPILPTLRLGYTKNLKSENDYVYTAGLGIKILVLNLDIVGMLRPDKVKIGENTQPLPTNLAVGLTLGMRF